MNRLQDQFRIHDESGSLTIKIKASKRIKALQWGAKDWLKQPFNLFGIEAIESILTTLV